MQQKNIIDLINDNDLDAVRTALDNGADVNTQDENKCSLLLIATVNQQIEIAKLLVARGADVNMQNDRLDSPFLCAAATRETELVKLFLANGARFDVFNRFDGSALTPACERGYLETSDLSIGQSTSISSSLIAVSNSDSTSL